MVAPEVEVVKGALSETLLRVLDQALTALEKAGIEYVVAGGLVARAYAIRETTDDIDVFVEPPLAVPASRALESAGFSVWIEDPTWLHKALKDGVEVDIIFESAGAFHVDEEAFRRAPVMDLNGRQAKVLSPEDFFVVKAQVATPVTPRHGLDAVKILRRYPLDWEYVVRRARGRPRKVLRALLLGQEAGVQIPSWVLATLARPTIEESK